MEYMSKIKNKFNRTLLLILVCLFPFVSQADLVPFEIKVHGTTYYFFANETAIDNKEMTDAINDLNSLLAKKENYCKSCGVFARETYPIPKTNLRDCGCDYSSNQDDLTAITVWDYAFLKRLSRIYTTLNDHSDCSLSTGFTVLLYKELGSNSESMQIETIKPKNSNAVQDTTDLL